MNRMPGLTKGCVKIKIQGEQTERFLNLCRNKGIFVKDIESIEEGVTCIVEMQDFFLLKGLRKKTGVKIHILEKKGLPFFLQRNKRRKIFLAGALFFIMMLSYLCGHLWNIQIEGNKRNSTQEILSFLNDRKIKPGIPRSSVNCGLIADAIREKYSDVAWVSVQLKGTVLFLTIKEGIFDEGEKEEDNKGYDLVADQEGVIVKMITRAGMPQVKKGDSCKKGDILISGRLELKNDNQEVAGYEYVHGDADIYVRSRLAYYKELPLEYEEEIFTGEEKKGHFLSLEHWYGEIGPGAAKGWYRTDQSFPVKVTDAFVLPVTWGRITWRHYTKKKVTRTEKEAKVCAWHDLQSYEEKLIEKGVQISSNNVKIYVDHKTCISKGSLEIIQKTGREAPTEILEQPAERTAEND